MATDYYDILGVSRSASDKEIQAAYKRMARKYHPDVTGGDKEAEERFKQANEAHEVLGDKDSRAAYDKWGDQWQHAEQLEEMQRQRGAFGGQQGFGGGPFASGPGGIRFEFGGDGGGPFTQFDDDGGGFGSIFDRLFRGGPGGGPAAGPAAPQRGHDLEHAVQVSLAEARAGTTRRIQAQSMEDGRPIGKQLEVTIPAGVETGSKVRLRGKGAPGINGGPAGDVVLVIEVAADPRFERKGTALHTDVAVPLTVAVLGGEAEVATLDGTVALSIPPRTQNGRVFRLSGKGMPALNAKKQGDLFARVRVVLPEDLSDEERELFQRLHALRFPGASGSTAEGAGNTPNATAGGAE